MTRLILAVTLISVGFMLSGCQEEKTETPVKVYEPPKLRSKADRQPTRAAGQNTDVRVSLKMDKDEVQAIQGQPDSVDVISYEGSREVVEKWLYPSAKIGCRQILFTNGKVTLLRNCVGPTNTKPKEG